MRFLASLALMTAAALPALSQVAPAGATASMAAAVDSSGPLAPADTGRRKRSHSVELSDWYYRRLTLHRYISYATIPVFAAQWAAGSVIFPDPRNAPRWAKTTHDAGADLLMGMFTVNTVTGAWNWWDSRSEEKGRTLHTVHALMMLTADGIFSYAGSTVAKEAETSLEKRRLHRTLALIGTGITVGNGLMMKWLNR